MIEEADAANGGEFHCSLAVGDRDARPPPAGGRRGGRSRAGHRTRPGAGMPTRRSPADRILGPDRWRAAARARLLGRAVPASMRAAPSASWAVASRAGPGRRGLVARGPHHLHRRFHRAGGDLRLPGLDQRVDAGRGGRAGRSGREVSAARNTERRGVTAELTTERPHGRSNCRRAAAWSPLDPVRADEQLLVRVPRVEGDQAVPRAGRRRRGCRCSSR